MASSCLRRMLPLLTAILLLSTLLNGQSVFTQPTAHPQPGCTTFYAYDGQTALGGNNEDHNNPFTYIWFIPASSGRFGRVLFGYDDFLPQGGLNDQGVFFDGLALPYKAMQVTRQRPHFPGGDLAYLDEILARSATIQDVIDIYSQWNFVGGEYGQLFYGDRSGDSVILDGDTILRKQGLFQIATNFRLVDHPDPPYPDERYEMVYNLLSEAEHYTVELFRQALDAVHSEGYYPTLYSQVYELNTGIIHLYQFHDFHSEVVLNLADELAKGPHYAAIASLFPENEELERWASQQEFWWKSSYAGRINTRIEPGSLNWMSGQYNLQQEPDAGPAKIYQDDGRLYMQKYNQVPIELYPIASDTVFHQFFNGIDLTLTFQRNQWGQVIGAQGAYTFDPYSIALPYRLTRVGVSTHTTSLLITLAGVVIVLTLPVAILFVHRRRRNWYSSRHQAAHVDR